jgi:hypothetical protein
LTIPWTCLIGDTANEVVEADLAAAGMKAVAAGMTLGLETEEMIVVTTMGLAMAPETVQGMGHEMVPGMALEMVPGTAHEMVPGTALEMVPGTALEMVPGTVPGKAHETVPGKAHEMVPEKDAMKNIGATRNVADHLDGAKPVHLPLKPKRLKSLHLKKTQGHLQL